MSDTNPPQGAGTVDETPRPGGSFGKDGVTDELKAALDWFRQLAGLGGAYSRLFALELRLALGDARRLLILGLLMIPVALLAWIALGALLSWLVYGYSRSVTWGLTAFFLIQTLTLAGLALTCRRYVASLSLPATRRHLHDLLAETRDETHPSER